MKKLVVAGFSLLAVGLLILGSQTNVVGYQTVQASQQNLIKERLNQKDLLFQTICDLANDKDIQRAILTSQLNPGFFNPGMKTLPINAPVLTKRQLEVAYRIGSLLSKTMTKSQVQSLGKQYHGCIPVLQKEISAIVEKDSRLKGEATQLSQLSCNCGLTNFTWHFPVICAILLCIAVAVELYFELISLFPNFPDIVSVFFLIVGGIAFVLYQGYCLTIITSPE